VPEIALNGLPLDYPHSGTAIYTQNLALQLPACAPDFSFRLFLRNAHWGCQRPHRTRLQTPFAITHRGHGLGARFDKLTWETLSLPLSTALAGTSLLHYLYFAAPPVAAAPVVVTIHDLIPLAVPGYYRTRQSSVYSRLMAWTVKRTAAIITVSNHSQRDIVRLLGVPESRVHVTHEAVDERFLVKGRDGELDQLRSKYRLPPSFFLYTGGAERRKNLETLVRAWRAAVSQLRSRGFQLVIVADFPPSDNLYPDIPGLVQELGLERDIALVSGVDEDDKPALYRAATAFCFPSRYEGFGFTPLEAMACGVPVSIPEVVGDAACLLEPDDIGGWTEAILHVADSAETRNRLRQQGLKRAANFSWQITAQQTAAVYREVLGR
jgi:glycosyltransferase involved in cell wall biosynthesis